MSAPWPRSRALRFLPLAGIAVGLMAAAVYYVAAQFWPTSIAVLLAMLATTLLNARDREGGVVYGLFALLLKYDALMALSTASVPLPLPPNAALGLIMIAAQAASAALVVSVLAGRPERGTESALSVTAMDLGIALVAGLAPACLLGIPGLAALVSAIVARLLLGALVLPRLPEGPGRTDLTHRVCEISFYLGALATWRYV